MNIESIEVSEKIVEACESESIFLRAKSVCEMLGISRSTFYALQQVGSKQYDETFPEAYLFSSVIKTWSRKELLEWARSRRVKRRLLKNGAAIQPRCNTQNKQGVGHV